MCVNCYDWGDNSLPFGGYKQSGIGRDKSLHALENYTQLKTTYINVLDDCTAAPIAEDDPRARDVTALLARHLAFAHATTRAAEDVFALDVDALAGPDVAFFSCRDDDGAVLGVGALKRLDVGARGDQVDAHRGGGARPRRRARDGRAPARRRRASAASRG